MIFRRALAFTLLCGPAAAMAACMDSDQNRLWNYQGQIAGKYDIGLTLVFKGEDVQGEYFYASQRKDIALRGRTVGKDELALEELDAAGGVTARFHGTLSNDCNQFHGTWQKAGGAQPLAFTASLSDGSSGTLDRRYAVAGAESDDLVHANATRFWLGVKNGNKKEVAAVMAYPVRAQLKGKKTTLRNAKEFIASYNLIFTPGYRDAVLAAVPHNMSASWRGIMLGEKGEVWLNAKGQPFALNN